ncbi:hypothetical protein PHYPO_G00177370 [Pangasianodon hypophthalmus]|uniref:Uncharacterized protein n=1 Tax=Pangasianodon hypophthalmus TaxID=310915 RepID=A0A5N5PPQ5_PANHP|nr:hypothetical protein PHYPO_G00177370 [Pangasianodon hypophthalmus]
MVWVLWCRSAHSLRFEKVEPVRCSYGDRGACKCPAPSGHLTHPYTLPRAPHTHTQTHTHTRALSSHWPTAAPPARRTLERAGAVRLISA